MTPGEERDIKDHLFFRNVNWRKIEDRDVQPPFIPKIVSFLYLLVNLSIYPGRICIVLVDVHVATAVVIVIFMCFGIHQKYAFNFLLPNG